MKRRTFIKKNAIVTLTPFITTGLLARNKKIKSISEKPFQLNYAPHFGMFESMAGKDLMDQIQFMHDQGFRSLEDNGMKNRSKKTQNDIAKKMEMQSIDSRAEKIKSEKPTAKTEPTAQSPKVIPLGRKRGRGKKSQIVVFREDDEKDLR